MSEDLDAMAALMPFARHLGVTVDQAGPDQVVARLAWAPHLCTAADRLVAQTTQVQAVRPGGPPR